MVFQWLQQGRRTLFASSVIFLLPVSALLSSSGMTLIQLVILFAVLWFANHGCSRYFLHVFGTIQWLVFGFAGYFVLTVGLVLFSSLEPSSLDGPLRLLLALTCIAFVGCLRPSLRVFWFGVCTGAIGSAVIAIIERLAFGVERAEGMTHHAITFGNLAMALGLMSLCALSAFRGTRVSFLPVLALMSGLAASILSGSRGGWVSLILCLFPLVYFGYKEYGRSLLYSIVLVFLLFLVAYLIPSTQLSTRIAAIGNDLYLYFSQGNSSTSLGIRLELWKASWMMFSDYPLFGVGRGQFPVALFQLVEQGRLQPSSALSFSSSHNDILYFLATGGLMDCVFLFMFYVGPLLVYLAVLRGRLNGDRQVALAGVLLVVCFIGFGLTDVMFWLMAPKIFYAMMACVLVGFCLIGSGRRAA